MTSLIMAAQEAQKLADKQKAPAAIALVEGCLRVVAPDDMKRVEAIPSCCRQWVIRCVKPFPKLMSRVHHLADAISLPSALLSAQKQANALGRSVWVSNCVYGYTTFPGELSKRVIEVEPWKCL